MAHDSSSLASLTVAIVFLLSLVNVKRKTTGETTMPVFKMPVFKMPVFKFKSDKLVYPHCRILVTP